MPVTRVRLFALRIVMSALEEGRWANKLIVPFLFKLEDSRDQRLLTELVYGTIKMKLRLDWSIARHLKNREIMQLTPPIRNVLRLGAYQLLFSRIPAYAAISESVKLARMFGHRGTASLVNAVLRHVAEDESEPDEPWIRYSHPEWLFQRLKTIGGEDWAVKVMRHNNTPAPIYIRVNTMAIEVSSMLEKLEDMGVAFRKPNFPPETVRLSRAPQLIDLDERLYYVQDRASQVVAHLMAPHRGWRIYDLAAAPGGKITHIAALMQDSGEIIAVELHESRAKEMEKVVRRLGLSSIKVVAGDGSSMVFEKPADAILADVPCSGLGTLRRRPELRWRMRPDRIPELVKIQRSLLENAARNLKTGGILIYSTCTIEPEENHNQIRQFLEMHPEFEIEPAGDFIPSEFTDGEFMFVDGIVHDCDFMFAARLRKTGES